uniref:BROMI C-terminal Rab TBC-like domain-containing protein n=1 Tax=Timema cristinae TaxID=61476 RepID=A0A7R9CD36_TIMCR|nr:unnamed protein product [Timema cristinae]
MGQQMMIIFQCLLSFILRVSSTPKGVALLLSENGLIEDVLRVQMCSPYVPWEDTQFRGAVSLLGATTEGAAVLSSESSGILRDSLNRLWAAYEDPEFMLSSNTMPTRAMQDFINVLCSLTYTFQGVVALLSERDDESSDETLVDFVAPTKLSELLNFESCVEPWHYVGLLTLRLLTSDLNVCLYLSNKLNFQDHLLKLQSENTINSEFDNFTLNSSCDEKDMIIDAHSLLRHQILVATYVVGGPSERTLPSTELCEELDKEESVPFLFSSYPPPQSYFKQTEVSPKTQTELHRFLKETRHGPHDSGWLLHARKAYRLSCHNDIKPLVLLDLFNQVAKCFYSDVTHQVDWSNVIPDTLFPAELEGIQLTIRYGVNCGLLQARPQNFDNLSYLLKQSHGSNGTPSSFEGFDWFLATAFLVSGGNLDRQESNFDIPIIDKSDQTPLIPQSTTYPTMGIRFQYQKPDIHDKNMAEVLPDETEESELDVKFNVAAANICGRIITPLEVIQHSVIFWNVSYRPSYLSALLLFRQAECLGGWCAGGGYASVSGMSWIGSRYVTGWRYVPSNLQIT